MKYWSLVIIVSLLATSPAFAQDLKVQSATEKSANVSVRPSYLMPPQGQPAAPAAKQTSVTSHKKRNIIIAVVAAAAVGGVIVAAHNGAYGGSKSSGY